MSDFAQHQLEILKFRELMKNEAKDAYYPVHESTKAMWHADDIQRTCGNKYLDQQTVDRASAWINTFLKGANNDKKR